jgi:hypothetical protein
MQNFEKTFSDSLPDAEEWRAARDRVLLYVRALDAPPLKDLELALESLGAAPSASPCDAMEALFGILEAHGLDQHPSGNSGDRLTSFPPINRGVMVAEPMDRVPWKTALVRSLRRRGRELLAGERAR